MEEEEMDEYTEQMLGRFDKVQILGYIYRKYFNKEIETFELFIDEVMEDRVEISRTDIINCCKELTMKAEILFRIFRGILTHPTSPPVKQKEAAFYRLGLTSYITQNDSSALHQIVVKEGSNVIKYLTQSSPQLDNTEDKNIGIENSITNIEEESQTEYEINREKDTTNHEDDIFERNMESKPQSYLNSGNYSVSLYPPEANRENINIMETSNHIYTGSSTSMVNEHNVQRKIKEVHGSSDMSKWGGVNTKKNEKYSKYSYIDVALNPNLEAEITSTTNTIPRHRITSSYPITMLAAKLNFQIENFNTEKTEYYFQKRRRALKLIFIHSRRKMRYLLGYSFMKYRLAVFQMKFHSLIAINEDIRDKLIKVESCQTISGDESLGSEYEGERGIRTPAYFPISSILRDKCMSTSMFPELKHLEEFYKGGLGFQASDLGYTSNSSGVFGAREDKYKLYQENELFKREERADKGEGEKIFTLINSKYESKNPSSSNLNNNNVENYIRQLLIMKLITRRETQNKAIQQWGFYKWKEFAHKIEKEFLLIQLEKTCKFLSEYIIAQQGKQAELNFLHKQFMKTNS